MRARPITHDDLRGLPGLRRAAADAIVAAQPRTVLDLLRTRDVGLKTAKVLLRAGLISDPKGVQSRSRFDFPSREVAAAPEGAEVGRLATDVGVPEKKRGRDRANERAEADE